MESLQQQISVLLHAVWLLQLVFLLTEETSEDFKDLSFKIKELHLSKATLTISCRKHAGDI